MNASTAKFFKVSIIAGALQRLDYEPAQRVGEIVAQLGTQHGRLISPNFLRPLPDAYDR